MTHIAEVSLWTGSSAVSRCGVHQQLFGRGKTSIPSVILLFRDMMTLNLELSGLSTFSGHFRSPAHIPIKLNCGKNMCMRVINPLAPEFSLKV